MTDDIRCICLPLPGDVRGFTVRKGDSYTIVLREDLDHDGRIRTYEHEVRHIQRGDFDRHDIDAGLIEVYAHR